MVAAVHCDGCGCEPNCVSTACIYTMWLHKIEAGSDLITAAMLVMVVLRRYTMYSLLAPSIIAAASLGFFATLIAVCTVL